jgi:2-oxoisovalerate dehydrogenase E1 component alpha subunit
MALRLFRLNRLVNLYLNKQSSTLSIISKANYANYATATSVSDKALFPGYNGEFTTNLEFIYPENLQKIQCYRLMNRKGVILDQSQDPAVINKT